MWNFELVKGLVDVPLYPIDILSSYIYGTAKRLITLTAAASAKVALPRIISFAKRTANKLNQNSAEGHKGLFMKSWKALPMYLRNFVRLRCVRRHSTAEYLRVFVNFWNSILQSEKGSDYLHVRVGVHYNYYVTYHFRSLEKKSEFLATQRLLNKFYSKLRKRRRVIPKCRNKCKSKMVYLVRWHGIR